jgi:hypothetical protein
MAAMRAAALLMSDDRQPTAMARLIAKMIVWDRCKLEGGEAHGGGTPRGGCPYPTASFERDAREAGHDDASGASDV